MSDNHAAGEVILDLPKKTCSCGRPLIPSLFDLEYVGGTRRYTLVWRCPALKGTDANES
jgi:hypothetical protein